MTVGHSFHPVVAQVVENRSVERIDVDAAAGGIIAGLIDLAIIRPAVLTDVVGKKHITRARLVGNIDSCARSRAAAAVSDAIHFERDRRRGSSRKSQVAGQGSAPPEVGRAGGDNLQHAA